MSNTYLILDDQYPNKVSMKELHDKFYELYDKLTECGDVCKCDVHDIANDFYEVYIWFVHYGCQDDDLKRAEELYDYLVYKYKQFNT